MADACELAIVRPVDKIFCCLACNCANSANSCGVFELFFSISNILPCTTFKACCISGVSSIVSTFCKVICPLGPLTSLVFGGRFCRVVFCAELTPPMIVVVVLVVVEGTSATGGGETEATVTAVGRFSDFASSTSSFALGLLV